MAIILGGGYFIYQKINLNNTSVNFVTATVEKGTLVVSVTGSGQVDVSDQINISPEVSSELTEFYAVKDQVIKKGQLLAVLDSSSAQEDIDDAAGDLEDAEYSLEQAEKNCRDIETEANRTLTNAYEDGYDGVSSAFFKLSGYVDDLKDALGTDNSSQEYVSGYELILGTNSQFILSLIDDYEDANNIFNETFSLFRTVDREDTTSTIDELITKTINTTKTISQALDSARHMFDAISLYDYSKLRSVASQIDTMQPKIESDVSAIYSTLNSLQNIKDTIDDTNEDTPVKIEAAQRTIKTAQNTVTKKQKALTDAQEVLEKYLIYAPFGGVIASLGDVEIGDTVSPNTTLATLITQQKIADISLNEVDAAKVKVGQKATITFDAIDELTVTGKIIYVDTLGTASQGVVDYGAKISLDATNEDIKVGMTVTVEIITAAKQNVLMVPTSAIKKQNGDYYVMVVNDDIKNATASAAAILTSSDLISKTIEIGSANDTMTEVVSGLAEDDLVVTSTKTSTSASSSNNSSANTIRTGSGGMEMQMMQIIR